MLDERAICRPADPGAAMLRAGRGPASLRTAPLSHPPMSWSELLDGKAARRRTLRPVQSIDQSRRVSSRERDCLCAATAKRKFGRFVLSGWTEDCA